jgi:hypothetical protein
LRASSSVIVGRLGSGTGRTVRSICCDANGSGSKLDAATSKCITGEFFLTVSDFIVIGLIFSVSLPLLNCPTMAQFTLDVDVGPSAVRMLKSRCCEHGIISPLQ